MTTPDPLLEKSSPRNVQTYLIEPSPQLGKGFIMWPISRGFFLVKRASPSLKGPPVSPGPSASRSSSCSHLFSFPGLCAGRRKHGKEHCVPRTIHFGKEEPGPSFCLPLNECGNNQKRARTALRSFLTSLGQFQGPLHRP